MQRNFLRPTLICLIPLLLAGWASWAAYLEGGFKLGVDLVGGTILVYEVDPNRTELLRGTTKSTDDPNAPSGVPKGAGLSKEEMQQLAAALKRRIDPTDLKNVTIRPVGNTRIEIILPAGGTAKGAKAGKKSDFTEEEILKVRGLVSQVGTLEFRILANNEDDKEAIDAARSLIDGLTPEQKTDLAQRAEPPPAPEGTFDVRGLSTSYAWLELDKEERMSLELNNDRELETATTTLWQQVAAARNEGRPYLHILNANGRATSMLIYSRKCEVPNPAIRDEKKYEYWVLTRAKDSVQVSGAVSISATVGMSSDYKVAVDFRFNSEGARQFRRLTSRNQPTPLQGSDTKVMRHLAIVLDGMIKSAPTINSVIERPFYRQLRARGRDAARPHPQVRCPLRRAEKRPGQ
jgi:SecD/SecF fusion protein